MSIKLLGISGSTRSESLNRRLLQASLRMAEKEGVQTTMVDLKDLAIPLYDGDLETASRTIHRLPEDDPLSHRYARRAAEDLTRRAAR